MTPPPPPACTWSGSTVRRGSRPVSARISRRTACIRLPHAAAHRGLSRYQGGLVMTKADLRSSSCVKAKPSKSLIEETLGGAMTRGGGVIRGGDVVRFDEMQ